MTYHQLISFFSRYQTSRIKPVVIEKCCAPNSIPLVIGQFIKDIFQIMEYNFDKLSCGKPIIGVLGLQPSGIKSNKARSFCYSLLYLPLTQNQLKSVTDWTEVKNIVVNFDDGTVLSPERYISELFKLPGSQEKIYGQIPKAKLTTVLQNIHRSII